MDDTAILAALHDFDPLWQHMSRRKRACLVEPLVETVMVDSAAGTVAITFRASGINTLTKEKMA